MSTLPPGFDPSKVPLKPNPSGAPPNFVDPPSLTHAQLVSGVTLIVFSVIFVVCRLATNWRIVRKFALDDALCVCALIFAIVYWGMIRAQCLMGWDRHAWDTPMSVVTPTLLKLGVITPVIGPTARWAAKSCILALYIRLFGKVTWLRVSCYVWIVLLTLFYGMTIIASFVYCFPRPGGHWDESTFKRCLKITWTLPTFGAFSCAADMVILILPFPIISKLQFSFRKKISLGLVFATGITLVVLSAVSLYIRILVFYGKDPTWDSTRLSIIATAEMCGTIMVSCAPALSAFWFRIVTESTVWSQIRSAGSSLRSHFSSSSPSERSLPSSPPVRNGSTQSDQENQASITKTTEYNVSEVSSSTNVERSEPSYNIHISGGSRSRLL